MNITHARNILTEAAHLIELTATFTATYGRDYRLKPGSPQAAWELYDRILQVQSRIGRLLEPESLKYIHYRFGPWWERRDVIDTAVAQGIITEAGHLIASCAHSEVKEISVGDAHAVEAARANIAGMLHPASLQVAADEPAQLNVG